MPPDWNMHAHADADGLRASGLLEHVHAYRDGHGDKNRKPDEQRNVHQDRHQIRNIHGERDDHQDSDAHANIE